MHTQTRENNTINCLGFARVKIASFVSSLDNLLSTFIVKILLNFFFNVEVSLWARCPVH